MAGPLFSGALFRNLVEEVEAAVGHDVTWKAAGDLTAEQREECLDILAIRWVHASTSVALVRAAAARAGRDPRELHALVVEGSTRRVFTTIWRTLFHFVEPAAMVVRVPTLFNRSYQGIRAEAALVKPGEAVITIKDWPGIDDLSFEGIAISIRVALSTVARDAVDISRSRMDYGAKYTIRWKT